MITKTQETIALVEHIIAFFCDLATVFFNNNTNIKFLCFIDIGQHIIKIIRIVIYGFALISSPPWFCYFHFFVNHFTHNSFISLACIVIFNLYAAIIHPASFSKYQGKIRPYIYIFVIIYTSIFVLAALYEPLILKYSVKHINESHNCSSAYRYKLYQYLLTSPITNLPFTIPAIICTFIMIYKIRVIPRDTLKNQISSTTKISFSRWLKILFVTFAITIISFLNLYCDIRNGIRAQKNIEKEEEKLGIIYYLTASSGILVFILSNSCNEIKKKLGLMKEWTTTDFYSFDTSNVQESFNPHLYYPSRKDSINNMRYSRNSSFIYNNSFNNSYNTSFNNSFSNNFLLNNGLSRNENENVMYYNNNILKSNNNFNNNFLTPDIKYFKQ
ncbi:hypothetical protein BCR32DRAFT_270259 [Anaeromyces robustus]|uniref:G-protein coupled receptors family 1 profile domain-containing protein n=1 Tax=Anaeromyces robustus TaxID=1754192 RepID=A0A1Y1WX24_9FUNG|nr:hypothetical protein BCR32DRAFT_270259 [Anaeromyces robustus]|eukprot:ORX78097.1 hypothetical protein BCR32DRAFT_270259 [Anaeromyces robustus]